MTNFSKFNSDLNQPSLLHELINKAVKPCFTKVFNQAKAVKLTNEASSVTANVLTVAPLFMDSPAGLIGSAIFNGLNQAKVDENLKTDFVLGAVKGLLLKGSLAAANSLELSASYKGVILGFNNTLLETSLNRQTYFNPDKNTYSLTYGLNKALSIAWNPSLLAVDGLSFLASETVLGAMTYKTFGQFPNSPILANTLTGGTFGFISGASNEMLNPQANLFGILANGLNSAITNSIAGSLGSLANENINFLPKVENLSPQYLNPEQKLLQDSKFTSIRKIANDKYLGLVDNFPDKQFIFRKLPDNSQTSNLTRFNQRIHQEVEAYKITKLMGLTDGFPLTSPVSIDIDGQVQPGYLQEIQGVALEDFLRQKANLNGSDSVSYFKSKPELRSSFTDALAQRMIFGEWDNHAHNFVINKAGKVVNIDLERSFNDLLKTPQYGKTLSRVSTLADKLAKDVNQETISPALSQKLTDFLSTYDTPSGKLALANKIQLQPSEIDSLLSRMRWLSTRQQLPLKPINNLYVMGLMKYKMLNMPEYHSSIATN